MPNEREQGINRVVAKVMGIGWHAPVEVQIAGADTPDIQCEGCGMAYAKPADYELAHRTPELDNPDFFEVESDGEPTKRVWQWYGDLVDHLILSWGWGTVPLDPATLARAVEESIRHGRKI